MKTGKKIALAGNPNSGKSSLFNALTGLRQKTGNFPGVTVEKKTGSLHTAAGKYTVIDIPGIYTVLPKSPDEKIAVELLLDKQQAFHPDLIVYVADATNLRRSLFLFRQLQQLGFPLILAVNMIDIAGKKGISINRELLSELLNTPVYLLSARQGTGLADLLTGIDAFFAKDPDPLTQHHTPISPGQNDIPSSYKAIDEVMAQAVALSPRYKASVSERLDRILTHKYWGYLIFLLVMFVLFQSVFTLSEGPMSWIEHFFAMLTSWLQHTLPEGSLTGLITQGILPGLSGVLIFLPQIALLFFFLSLLEDSGYMVRVSYLMDKLMRPLGLNGRSVVPLISGAACAIPAIMSARTISNHKDRLITILVTPLVSCSARLPVYSLLIGMAIPATTVAGFLSLQGITLAGLYFLGFFTAALAALVFKKVIRGTGKSYFVMEVPEYRTPNWKNIFFTIYEKCRSFVVQAGKVIVAISIILWVLASYGPGNDMEIIRENTRLAIEQQPQHREMIVANGNTQLLEASYAGRLGKIIEPTIRPLGFDWKIGIALITSFAAREVFVGTMATIYSVGDDQQELQLREKLQNETDPETGMRVFSFATVCSLLVFYAFAMQCMSTFAITYKETASLKWPLVQFLYMSILAYIASFITYTILS